MNETVVFIGFGSNINPEENITSSMLLLKERVHINDISPIYKTEPVGYKTQPDFLNGVVKVSTDMNVLELSNFTKEIEKKLKRTRTGNKFGPRTIDMDILLFGNRCFPELNIPHPDIFNRNFVAIPLFNLQPDLTIPPSNTPLREVVLRMSQDGMIMLRNFSKKIRSLVSG